MDYIFRRLALDHLPYEQRAALGILSAAERSASLAGEGPGTGLADEPDTEEMAQSAPLEDPPPGRKKQAGPGGESAPPPRPAARPS